MNLRIELNEETISVISQTGVSTVAVPIDIYDARISLQGVPVRMAGES